MTDIDSLAAALFGSKRAESQEVLTDATTRTYVGTALTDSKDGTVMVDLGGDVTLPDDVEGVSEHSAEGIEVSTGPGVRAGDEVVVTLVGGTPLKTPMVTGVAGEGDDQDARIATASAAAEEAWQWADEAHTAATDAQASASAAQESASSAASAASSAVSSAARAEQSAQQAIGDAARAESAAQQAVEDAADAEQAAGEAKTSAQQAIEEANEAHDAATAAQAEASRASQSATEAKGAATRANTAANDALAQVATVEDVIGVVDWVTEHGTYSLTTDTAIDPDKVYYTRSGSGTQADPYLYAAVPEPVADDLGTYYELSVQEALSQYVASHLALTDAGLYVLKDGSGYRLLLTNDGMQVIDPAGHTVATYGESITFDSERPQRIGGTDSYIEWRDTDSDGVPDSLVIVADSIELGSGQSVSTGSGNVWANHTSATSASGISSWSDSFVAPTTAKPYVWMKSYSVIDGQRVYGNPACITGAKGADGTSVSVTSIEYATSTTESQPSSGWSTTAPSTVAEGSWLWTRVNYSDGSAAVSRAKQGKSGTSGSSSYTHIRYSAQADGTGFVSTPTASTVYVGIAVTSSSSAPTAKGSYTWSRYVGQQGPQGPQGETGETGVGVESYAQMWAKSTSKTTAPTSGWSESRPTSIGTNEYLWVRIDTTWTDNITTQGTPVVDLNVTDLWHTSAALRVDVDSIDSDVEGLKTTVSGHTTTIQQHTTSISQNSDAIALRATKTEVQQVRPAYASSSTAAGTAAKVATIDPAVTGYALYKGATVAVTFSTANTAATPTLNLNSTGAKQIRSYTGAALSEAEYKWAAGATIDLVYDGTYWRMQDGGSVKRVTAAEASIKVNADNIESKVSKDGVISSINQSAETVKIQASKVEIDGTAIFTAISSDVDDAITDKGYQTSSQVESAITSKGYATTTQAQGYASTAKSEAISAAATDATSKANAAQTAATNAANTATDNKLKSYSTTAQANNLYDAKGAAAAVETNSGNLFLGASMADRSTFTNNSSTDFSRHFRYYNGSASIHSFSEYSPGVYQDTVTLENSGNLGIAFARMADEMGLDSTSSYTITCWAKCSKAGMNLAIGLSYYNTSNSWVWRGGTNATAFSAADTWQKFSLTFKPDADTKAICYCFTVAGGTGSETFTIRNCWLEKNAAYDAQTTANAAAPKANAVKRTQRIWYRTNGSSAPSTPGTASSNWVTKADDGNDAWTKMHIAISSTHKYIYTCEQYEMANGTVGYTSVLLDNTITVIDGGNIITGSVTANKLNAANINASKTLTVGAMTDAAASSILNSNVVVGGRNLLLWTANLPKGSDNTVNGKDGIAAWGDALGQLIETDEGIRLNAAGNATECIGIPLANNGSVGNNEDVLLTFEARGNITSIGQFFWLQASGSNVGFTKWLNGNQTISLSETSWTKFTTNVKHAQANIRTCTRILIFYGLGSSNNGKWVEIRKGTLKLEKGNKATDWTPAPEDQIAYVDSIQVGGRNLATGTANSTDFTCGSAVTYFAPIGFYPTSDIGLNLLKDTSNTKFTLSFDWSTANVTTAYNMFPSFKYTSTNYASLTGGPAISVPTGASSGHYEYTFEPTSAQRTYGTMWLLSKNNTNTTQCGTVTISNFMFECANKASTWTPAPEDMATAESLAGTNESLDGAIADIGELSDQLVGTVTEQNKTITDIQTYLNSLRKDLDAEIQSRQQWLNFNATEGLVIGAAGSTFKTVTTNTSQQFRSGGTVLAETSGTEFVAPVMRSDQILIGNWMWTRRDNGNLSLKWIG